MGATPGGMVTYRETGVPLAAFSVSPGGRLEKAYAALCRNPSPSRRAERFLLPIYLTMLGLRG